VDEAGKRKGTDSTLSVVHSGIGFGTFFFFHVGHKCNVGRNVPICAIPGHRLSPPRKVLGFLQFPGQWACCQVRPYVWFQTLHAVPGRRWTFHSGAPGLQSPVSSCPLQSSYVAPTLNDGCLPWPSLIPPTHGPPITQLHRNPSNGEKTPQLHTSTRWVGGITVGDVMHDGSVSLCGVLVICSPVIVPQAGRGLTRSFLLLSRQLPVWISGFFPAVSEFPPLPLSPSPSASGCLRA